MPIEPSALRDAIADRYRIERELGAGGMATVYLAHDVRHDRKVAVKVLRPELSAILGAERFLAEIKTTANLQHPHILSLFDSGEAAGLVFYVMPFVDGESLRDRLARDHQLPVDEAVRIAREVADALEYAHQHGIVHRDIKPENILLHGGHAVVADFGIALAAARSDGGSRMTETGMSLGTPHYMSPEQAMGEREITPKADIYALGCVLYEMLTAEPPFVGASAQAIIGRVLTEEPRSLTAQRKTIPPHVEAAVQTALAKLPADRFASAREFSEALGRPDFAPVGTRAHAATSGPDARPSIRSRVPWGVAALATVAALAAWLARSEAPPVMRERILLWSHAIDAPTLGRQVAISPDGRLTVFVDTVGGTQRLWSKSRDRVEAVALAGTDGAARPTFSPTGEWIAFVADGKVKRIPVQGGSAIVIADSATSVSSAVAWLDDGTILFNNATANLQAVSLDGGPQRRVFWSDSLQRGVVAVSPLPRGRGALITTCTGGCTGSDLRVLDLGTNESRILSEEALQGWYLESGDVVFVRRDGGVFIAPFDLDELAFAAAPVPVLNGVRASASSADMVLSADGTLLYIVGSGVEGSLTQEAVYVSREGAVSLIDSSWTFQPDGNGGIALSPDGQRLAVTHRTGQSFDVWIKQLPRGPFTRLTFTGNNLRPAWTANGRDLLYMSARGGPGEDLFTRRADGTGSETLLLDEQRSVVEVAVTPDTSRLIIRRGTPPSRDIQLLTRRGDSAAVTPLIAESGFQEVLPRLSPDGRWLAYASDESGRFEVYVRPFPDANSGRWQVSRNGGSAPGWSRSGRELFYRDGGFNMVVAAVTPGSTFATGDQRVLFSASRFLGGNSAASWAITPDDRRFIFMKNVGTTEIARPDPTPVIRVDNWLTELKDAGTRRP